VGFTPFNRVTYNEVNIDQLKDFPKGSVITPEALVEARLIRDQRKPVAILGRGEVKVALKVRVQRVTKGARGKIEAAGGSVEVIE